jgi:hypothetical protein
MSMMRRGLLLALLLVACDNRNYVEVSVHGISDFTGVTALRVDVTHNSQTAAPVNVGVASGAETTPFTFSLGFDRDRTGQVTLNLMALNAAEDPLARGNTVANIVSGSVGETVLTLQSLSPPSINRLTPNCYFPEGGVEVFVNGSDFFSRSVVLFDGVELPTTFNTGSQLRIVAPNRGFGFEGISFVRVRNPDGQTSNSVPFYYRLDLINCP